MSNTNDFRGLFDLFREKAQEFADEAKEQFEEMAQEQRDAMKEAAKQRTKQSKEEYWKNRSRSGNTGGVNPKKFFDLFRDKAQEFANEAKEHMDPNAKEEAPKGEKKSKKKENAKAAADFEEVEYEEVKDQGKDVDTSAYEGKSYDEVKAMFKKTEKRMEDRHFQSEEQLKKQHKKILKALKKKEKKKKNIKVK